MLKCLVVHKIPCGCCSWNYIGETGRSLPGNKKEHIRNVKTAAKGSRISNHTWSHNTSLTHNNASSIDKGNFRNRKFLESWHTSITPNADSNSCPISGQYRILFNKKFLVTFLSLISLYCNDFYFTIYFPNFYFIHFFFAR